MGRRSKPKQLELAFKSRGGRRCGAGRKRKGPRARVPHCARAEHDAKCPSFVTLRVRERLPSLRRREAHLAILWAFAAGKQRFGFRLVLYSVQSNHMHLMVEAEDRRALSRGLVGLQVRVARSLNRVWNRKGPVFEYSYHERMLSSPREVRNALVYLLNNARKHGIYTLGPDRCSSGAWFDGWRGGPASAVGSSVTACARTWLLRTGWKRHGLLDVREVPGFRRRSSRAQRSPESPPARSMAPEGSISGNVVAWEREGLEARRRGGGLIRETFRAGAEAARGVVREGARGDSRSAERARGVTIGFGERPAAGGGRQVGRAVAGGGFMRG